ncbi:phenylpropionate dioxygenase-like ring-hydroxylating dioxygenase large terminal subunit [Humitalea rosea]|uniref:Phenylpropionate dioxygenase-like ring-hydroxylating dioxygenase large terminal subunit n=1 Tax=Humitalea rosea TaxID=990373 RepID=A0A2W7IGI2_9PROT|nr:aromatic ring-hydroxylating dioxygenase subunit alpha [Humitalea rosea]PZW44762.1 phenylpropionate dioxygenase-like ring-hydroxylating dioxygenase large terminal subunit [Humitalea rosea]
MISAEQNERLTRVGPGTPGGHVLRHYWQPIALLDELDPKRPVRAVRALGQDFVLFRDETGRLGLLDRDCPHRGADLAFGRLEDGGLRCPFHGWLFDAAGACLDTPAEPVGSTLCSRIHQRAYPVEERSGIVFAYLGEGEAPPFPAFDCFAAPATHTFAFKGLIDCNWLQALEVGIDPAHASFLHRFFDDGDAADAYGKQFRATSDGSDLPMTYVLREFSRPRIEVENTDYGLRLFALREINDATMHVRVTNLFFPQAFVIPMSSEMTITQWHMPVDDESCYWIAIFTSFAGPVDHAAMRGQRLASYSLPDYLPKRGRHDDYGFDAEEQASATYTGMGEDINTHDQWAVESQGKIQDRTREHLASTDKAIAANRRLLLRAMAAIEEGRRPALMQDAATASLTGPGTIDGMAPKAIWEQHWKDAVTRRRGAAPWAPPALAAE